MQYLMDKFLQPTHPASVIITRTSEHGENYFLTNLMLYIVNEHEKIYIYSPSIHQHLYQKLPIPTNIIQNKLNEEDFDIVVVEIVINEENRILNGDICINWRTKTS